MDLELEIQFLTQVKEVALSKVQVVVKTAGQRMRLPQALPHQPTWLEALRNSSSSNSRRAKPQTLC